MTTYVIHNDLRPGRYYGHTRGHWVHHSEARRWTSLNAAMRFAGRLAPFYKASVHKDVHGGIVGHSEPVEF